MTELLIDWAEECFIAGNIEEAHSLAASAKSLDPFFGSIDKYVAAYGVHVAMKNKKTPTGQNNYYRVLGFHDTSPSIEEVNQRFRIMAPLVYPDTNCSAAAREADRQVRLAWHILTCESKRRDYDIRAGFRTREELRRRKDNIGSSGMRLEGRRVQQQLMV